MKAASSLTCMAFRAYATLAVNPSNGVFAMYEKHHTSDEGMAYASAAQRRPR